MHQLININFIKIESFIEDIKIKDIAEEAGFPCVFIRAPVVSDLVELIKAFINLIVMHC